MGFRNPILGGGGALVRPAIKSPNYLPGISGWEVSRSGNAEFNDLDVRGVFNGTNYVLNSAGLFFYLGMPAAGNMLGSWAGADGVDLYGNTYVAGVSLYDGAGTLTNFLGGPLNMVYNRAGDEWVGMNVGNFLMGVGDPAGGMDQSLAGLLGVIGTGDAAVWQSPATATGFVQQAFITLHAGTATGGPGTVNAPQAQIDGDLGMNGNLVKLTSSFDIPSWRNVPEVWHTPAYNTNWGGSTTFNTSGTWGTLQYRLDPSDNVVVVGAFKAGATVPAAAVFQFPVGYRPKKQWPVWVQRNNAGALSGGFAGVSTAGNFNLLAANIGIAAGNEYLVAGSFPLGNIP